MSLQSIREIIHEMGGIEKANEQMVARTNRIRQAPAHSTYEEIIAIEPRIERLRLQIPALMSAGNFWCDWSHIKKRLFALVGWDCENPQLSSASDWQIVFDRLMADAEKHANRGNTPRKNP